MLEIKKKSKRNEKNVFDRLIRRLDMTKEKSSEFEGMSIETSKTEKQRAEKTEKTQNRNSKNSGSTTEGIHILNRQTQEAKRTSSRLSNKILHLDTSYSNCKEKIKKDKKAEEKKTPYVYRSKNKNSHDFSETVQPRREWDMKYFKY